MKKFFHIFGVLCLIFPTPLLIAQERTIDNVKDIVCTFFATDSGALSRSSSATYRNNIQITDIKKDNTTYLYAVNMPEKGWAIVSNEQRYPEIIGYSTESYFDTNLDNQPGALGLLLDHHMNMIDSLRESPSTFYARVSGQPLSTSSPDNIRSGNDYLLQRNGVANRWMQRSNNGFEMDSCNKVYNKFCPTGCYDAGCGHAYTGCTAVAIAQVLWYWHWPDYAFIKDGIYCSGITHGNTHRHYYDWNNMPPTIDNNTPLYQVDMVAGLLNDCGIAANTVYTIWGSSADVIQLEQALDTFRLHWVYNFNYHWTDVTSLLINEIQAQRPVICQAGEEGSFYIHTFVIDGYNPQTGLFHLNFGSGGDYGFWNIGFNGYTVARSFFTELYPICSAREASVTSIDVDTIENGKDVTLYSANNVSLSQLTVENGGHLNVSVGGTITLGSGFKAQLGSAVKLSPNYNCSTGTSVAPVSISKRKDINKIDSTKKTDLSVSPNPAISEINIQCEEPINTISLFNINGQEVLQTKQMQIDISHLPNGIYIIRAITKDGEILQKKLIHE